MSSKERLLPQPEVIESLSQTSVLIPHPGELGDDALTGILAESIFLTSKKVRIIASYQDFVEQIDPMTIDQVRKKYNNEDTFLYILEQAEHLSWADEVVIETFE